MTWKETSVLKLRTQFIKLYQTKIMSISDLCREFGISRPTAYKFIRRFEQLGEDGLIDLPRRPNSHPNATPKDIVEFIVDLRTAHPHWSAPKMKLILERDYPMVDWPAHSTIGSIIKNHGLVPKRRRKTAACATPSHKLTYPDAPCSVWTADFKGQFRLASGEACYPLTIVDSYSRMILKCHGLLSPSFASVLPQWVAVFREHGLPAVIRTDNGSPFASIGLGGLSRLSAWWIRLGIMPERIQPGSPQQNARHEQMHSVLKVQTAAPPKEDLGEQQKAFDEFVEEYNNIRPHAGIGNATPASLFIPSDRRYPLILPEIEYPSYMQIRHVRTDGSIKWKGRMPFVSEVLTGECVGLDQIDDRLHALYYGPMPLAILDDHTGCWLPHKESALIIARLREESSHNITNV